MADLDPAGLEWLNKGLKTFLNELKNVSKNIERIAKATETMAGTLQKIPWGQVSTGAEETTEYVVEYTDTTIAATEETMALVTTMEKDVPKATQKTSTAMQKVNQTMQWAGGNIKKFAGAMIQGAGAGAIFGKGLRGAVAGLALTNTWVAVVIIALKALTGILGLAVKVLVIPIKGFISLGKAIAGVAFELLKGGLKFGLQAAQDAIIALGNAAIWTIEKFTRLVGAALQAGVAWEDAAAGIKKAGTDIVDVTGQLTATGIAVFDQFEELARRVPLPITDLLRIGELGAQMDIADTSLAQFAEIVAALTVATQLSAEEAALGMGKIVSVMGVGEDQISRLGSSLVWLGNNMGIVEDEILLFGKRITGAAAQAGLAAPEVLGIAAAFLRLGATPYAGASAVQQAIVAIQKAISLGGDELEIFAGIAGQSVDEFVEAWRTVPADTFFKFVLGLSAAGEDAILLLDELGLSNIRVLQSFLSAAAAPEELDKALRGSIQAWEDNTALTREASIRYATVASRIQLVGNTLKLLGKQVFDFLYPVIIRLLSIGDRLVAWAGTWLTQAFERLEPAIQDVVDWIDNLTLGLGFLEASPGMRSLLRVLLDMLGLDYTRINPLLDIFDEITEGIRATVEDIDWGIVYQRIQEWFGQAIDWVILNWPIIRTKVEEVITWIRDYDWAGLWETFTTEAGKVVAWVIENWPKIRKTIEETYNEITDFLFGPKISGPFLGAEQDRVGGFIDGLIIGFESVETAVENAATAIRTEIVPALEQAIVNLAVMLGMEPDAGPMEAGQFVAEKFGQLITLYSDILTVLAKTAEIVSTPFPWWRPWEDWQLSESKTGVEELGDASETAAGQIGQMYAIRGPIFKPEALPSAGDLIPRPEPDTESVWTTIYANLTASASTFSSNIVGVFETLSRTLWGGSIVPDMMEGIYTTMTTKWDEILPIWRLRLADLRMAVSLEAIRIETRVETMMSDIISAIEAKYPDLVVAGENIVKKIAEGMRLAAWEMIEALKDNLIEVNVAVDTNEEFQAILFEIGEKIVTRIANAIVKSYGIIEDALERAMSLGGALIHTAAAGAQNVIDELGDVSEQVTNGAGAATAPVTAPYVGPGVIVPGAMITPTGERAGVAVTVGPNYVRDDLDMAALETVVRRTVAEEVGVF